MKTRLRKILKTLLFPTWIFLPPFLVNFSAWFFLLEVLNKLRALLNLSSSFGFSLVLYFWSFAGLLIVALQIVVLQQISKMKLSGKKQALLLLSAWAAQTIVYFLILLITQLVTSDLVSYEIPLADILKFVLPSVWRLMYIQLITVTIFAATSYLKRKGWLRPRKLPVALLTFVIASLLLATPYLYHLLLPSSSSMQPEKINYDVSAHDYRSVAKEQTQLGQLPRPLKVLSTDIGWIGITNESEHVELTLLNGVPTNIDQLFLDVFTDRAYYAQDGSLFLFDIFTGSTFLLSENLQIGDKEIISVHDSEIAFQSVGGGAGTGNIEVLDISNGELLYRSSYLGYDQNRLQILELNNQIYQVFFDTPQPQSDHPTTLHIYMRTSPDSYQSVGLGDARDTWGRVVFNQENSWFFEDKTPVYTFKTAYKGSEFGVWADSRFSLRNWYVIDENTVAVELETSLVVMDIQNQSAKEVGDEDEIEELLAAATLLSSDDENAHTFVNACGAFDDSLSSEERSFFQFCLK